GPNAQATLTSEAAFGCCGARLRGLVSYRVESCLSRSVDENSFAASSHHVIRVGSSSADRYFEPLFWRLQPNTRGDLGHSGDVAWDRFSAPHFDGVRL
ncbi:MAG: hypothetical protein AVDCRST_MAG86-1435, partial [uncultured Truepera sp.]